ncbi:MAG: gamma-glutamyl-gamma-aminobutyrate hydrolase family protein [Clostridia bacterium]|nr:gamma-glutamyl-gamma-aminobutyrate hydrolase family protein [Clostridia bacterium]
MKPKILIVSEDGFAMDTGHFVISLDYGKAISQAGGLPLVAFDVLHADAYVDMADGLFLTGGPDMHCYRYGEIYRDRSEITPFSRTRDDLDFALCQRFLQAGKPVFGVGRGMQVLNVALGGTLYKDIARETGSPHPDVDAPKSGYDATTAPAQFAFHTVSVQPGTRMAGILDPVEKVNSCHHEAVRTLGDGLIAAAAAPDGIIEAIEHRTLPCFGVQWHPERAAGSLPCDGRLFTHFVHLCKEAIQ